jgi:hypothetical protein
LIDGSLLSSDEVSWLSWPHWATGEDATVTLHDGQSAASRALNALRSEIVVLMSGTSINATSAWPLVLATTRSARDEPPQA